MLNNYRIEKKVGQGGIPMVYKAYYASTDRFVADKDTPSRLTQDRKLSKWNQLL
jgi:serine/threonine protein kinase